MMRTLLFVLLAFVGYLNYTTPVHAANTNVPANFTSWSNYDGTVYMVSTLNQVHLPNRAHLTDVLVQQYGVTRYAVWQDLVTGTYLIQFKRATGANVGMVANHLGWPFPVSHSRLTDALGVARPAVPVEQHFRVHAKLLLGSLSAERPL